jgi:hypothetical protein
MKSKEGLRFRREGKVAKAQYERELCQKLDEKFVLDFEV